MSPPPAVWHQVSAALLRQLSAQEPPDWHVQLAEVGDAPKQASIALDLWRVDSPLTEPVLAAVAAHAPPLVAKAARTGLHRLRSARGRSR